MKRYSKDYMGKSLLGCIYQCRLNLINSIFNQLNPKLENSPFTKTICIILFTTNDFENAEMIQIIEKIIRNLLGKLCSLEICHFLSHPNDYKNETLLVRAQFEYCEVTICDLVYEILLKWDREKRKISHGQDTIDYGYTGIFWGNHLFGG